MRYLTTKHLHMFAAKHRTAIAETRKDVVFAEANLLVHAEILAEQYNAKHPEAVPAERVVWIKDHYNYKAFDDERRKAWQIVFKVREQAHMSENLAVREDRLIGTMAEHVLKAMQDKRTGRVTITTLYHRVEEVRTKAQAELDILYKRIHNLTQKKELKQAKIEANRKRAEAKPLSEFSKQTPEEKRQLALANRQLAKERFEAQLLKKQQRQAKASV